MGLPLKDPQFRETTRSWRSGLHLEIFFCSKLGPFQKLVEAALPRSDYVTYEKDIDFVGTHENNPGNE